MLGGVGNTGLMHVAFCGLGRMGAAMARHVLDAGHSLTVWNRSPGKAGDLVAAGATEAASPAEAAAGAEAVVLMLFGPESSREVLLGPDGIAAGARPGTLVIDATTIGPAAARELGSAAAERGLRYVDAPVAGSVQPATDGTLGVLAGGSDADLADARPLLELWGDPEKIRHLGPVGAGSAMKLVINLTIGVAIAGVGEAMRLGNDLELDRAAVLDVLGNGPLQFTVKQKRAMLESGDFSSSAFALDLMAKDLELCLAAADHDLATTAVAAAAARDAMAAGHARDDYSALAGYLADEADTR